MRYVIFGAGAIGGLVGGRLHESGHEVVLIARGENYEAIAEHGLRLRTPLQDVTLDVPAARSIAEAELQPGDVVLLCVKSQDTPAALEAIRRAAPAAAAPHRPRLGVPIVCLQNGVENEREALRLFPDVYGGVVLIPAEHLQPGEVICYGGELDGQIDIGRYPGGVDDTVRDLCAALERSHFASVPREQVTLFKYAKLLNNLYNAVDGICALIDPDGNRQLSELAQQEAREVLAAAGIECDVPEIREIGERWVSLGLGVVDGHHHRGSSTWQSVARGLDSAETDYLTGEIVLLARQHGHPAPVNELLQDLIARTVAERREPGWIRPSELLALLA